MNVEVLFNTFGGEVIRISGGPISSRVRMDMPQKSTYETCAERLRALADPERLRIIDSLRDGAKTVGQICEELGDEMVKVSHHLRVLRHAELVQRVKSGRHVVYSLPEEVYAAADRSKARQHIDLGCCRLELSPTLNKPA
jgi:DNA-binding transcriptional ArsR family regulator